MATVEAQLKKPTQETPRLLIGGPPVCISVFSRFPNPFEFFLSVFPDFAFVHS